jgi:thiamine monophosphate kinase
MGEFELITRKKSPLLALPSDVIHRLGDDSAVSTLFPECQLVPIVDHLVEEVHDGLSSSPYLFGRERLPVNVRDIVPISARLCFAFLPAANSQRGSAEFLVGFLKGSYAIAAVCRIAVMRENNSTAPNPSFVNVAIGGKGKQKKMGIFSRKIYPIRQTF